MYFMRDFENVEFKRRRGPLSAITKSKIARALRGKRRRPSTTRAAIRGAAVGAIVGGVQGMASGFDFDRNGNLSYNRRNILGNAAQGALLGGGALAAHNALIAKGYLSSGRGR